MKFSLPKRYIYKTYCLLGPFEIQYGHLTHSLGFWWYNKRFKYGSKWFEIWAGNR